ncbi:MAG: TRAP transporter large permease subunit [Dethiobacter sp.]|nr:MAG: TRAP transporter large permease subunit [Dethiobacter sp.]
MRNSQEQHNIIEVLDNITDKISLYACYIALFLMGVICLFIFSMGFLRYILGINIPGIFELTVDAMVIFPFLSAAYVWKEKGHIIITVFTTKLSIGARRALDFWVSISSLFFPALLCWLYIKWAFIAFEHSQKTVSPLPYPKAILLSIITFGLFLLLIQIFKTVIANFYLFREHIQNVKKTSIVKERFLYYPIFYFGAIIISILIFLNINKVLGVIFLFLTVMFAGMPIFLALGVAGSYGIYYFTGLKGLSQIPLATYGALQSFPLAAMPLFIIGGLIMEESGIVQDLFNFLEVIFRKFLAGLPIATILVGAIICATTGSSLGATAVVTAVVMPILLKRGYNAQFCSGLIGASTVGSLIPPSVGVIVYAVISNDSIGGLFMALLGPAAVLFGLLILYTLFISFFKKELLIDNTNMETFERRTSLEKVNLFSLALKAIYGIIMPVFVIGGIYFGIFTPTEAAAFLVVYAMAISLLVKKRKLFNLGSFIIKSGTLSTSLLLIMASAAIFGAVVSRLRIAPMLVNFFMEYGLNKFVFIVLVFFVLVVLGMFINASTITIITLPIFHPVAMAYDINPIVFAMFYLILLEMGTLTPPVGLNLFTISSIGDIPLTTVIKGHIPFLIIMVITIIFVFLVPEIATWLPSTMIR